MSDKIDNLKYVAFLALKFADNSEEYQKLHEGTQEECDQVQNLIPACTYSGSKQPVDAGICVWSKDEFEKTFSQR